MTQKREWTNPRTGATQQLEMVDHSDSEVAEITVRSLRSWQAFRRFSSQDRARVLRIIADALDSNSDEVVGLADEESALGIERLSGEVRRTSFQLRLFAGSLDEGTLFAPEAGDSVEGPPPAGRPELVRHFVPLGPVAVFGASNFPFAFGVLGGDFASALAAGCTVVVKEHSAHPRLSMALVSLARNALETAGEDPDMVLSVRGTAAGVALVMAPPIAAVGFTGSLSGGRFLFDKAMSRPHPIPFYGELGSINPVLVSREAAQSRAQDIGQGFVDSLLLGAGQFCTKPSVLIFPEGSGVLEEVSQALATAQPLALLTTRIADSYRQQVANIEESGAHRVSPISSEDRPGSWVTPAVFVASVSDMLGEPTPVQQECFGPAAILVPYATDEEALKLAWEGEPALVGCVHGEASDPLAGDFVRALASRTGRVVWNGWPTGVAVAPSQMHGGPYPASTVPSATSVGLHAAARFARPVAFQSVPPELQP
jgi:NADP-dependent aldehyde dehydrogenase